LKATIEKPLPVELNEYKFGLETLFKDKIDLNNQEQYPFSIELSKIPIENFEFYFESDLGLIKKIESKLTHGQISTAFQ
jgi:hypothetical protein